jgi:cation diffusion facilitator CzcD-associated flavoprotein CzcO
MVNMMLMQPRGLAPFTVLAAALLSHNSAHAFKVTSLHSYSYLTPLSNYMESCTPSTATAATAASSGTKRAMLHTNREKENVTIKRIGIIGGGAAGLAAARAFLHANDRIVESENRAQCTNPHVHFEVTVLEARNSIGGIWKYESSNCDSRKSRPMYRNLRTNLPKELMAYREFPWGGDGKAASYVTHEAVQQYLEEYVNKFNLLKCIHFGCTVTHLRILNKDHDNHTSVEGKLDNCDSWPLISLKWTGNDKKDPSQQHEQIFDAVCICNGHYAIPSIPLIPGLTNFRGKVIHAVEYDDPNDFVGKTVLCVGARASGVDISREIGCVSSRVYLSDSTCQEMLSFGNVVLIPRMQSIDENGTVHFSIGKGDEMTVDDVDTIIFCSGYDYSFPFIDDESNLELFATPGERRVRPLFEQLWHAHHPSLAFLGLPHSVVPFPLFELQAAAVVSQWTKNLRMHKILLPPLVERIAAAERDASSGGPDSPGRVVNTHYLGSYQFDYCRNLARIAGVYDDVMEDYIATNEAIYDRSGKERKIMEPGGRDSYRETRFRRLDGEQSYDILHSEVVYPETAARI